jgi:hypothetical protein
MSGKRATDPNKESKGNQRKVHIPGTYQTDTIGEIHHDPSTVVNLGEKITPFTDEELSVMKKEDPLVEIHGTIPGSSAENPIIPAALSQPSTLVMETPRYFVSCIFNFYFQGYKSITLSGIRTLDSEDLDNIEDTIHRVFQDEILAAGKEITVGWSGFPKKPQFILQQINRL